MDPTPSTNDTLPLRPAAFDTLAEALDYAARGRTGLNFFSVRGELARALGYAELRELAVAQARRLIRAGLAKGARFLMLADTDPSFVIMFMACQYAGILPVPVALPIGLGGKDAYIGALRRQIEGSGASAAMAPPELMDYLREAGAGLGLALVGSPADFEALPEGGVDPRPFGPDESSYLQYSSGSTRFPLGVDIRQRALAANCRAIVVDGLRMVPGDRCASWLPLYHDMGLVGFLLTPLFAQMSVDTMTTRDFARRPLTWLQLLSRHGGTLAFSPSFGYELCARRAADASAMGLDLRRWRVAGIGGDMIRPSILARFAEAFGPYGFRAEAFVPSYGMAEATLALSFSALDRGVLLDRVDRRRLAEDKIAEPAGDGDGTRSREFVLCGRPLGGHHIEVRGADGQSLPERRLGRIFAKGPSITAGYFNEPEATRQVFDDRGWLDTGDLGYLVDGQIVITGRAKDLIIVNGRNIWPQDLEWTVEEIPALRRGDAAAFSVEDDDAGEHVVVLVQCRLIEPSARQALAAEVSATLRRSFAVETEVVLVAPHALPQTSSGKLSRGKAKTDFLAGLHGSPPGGDDRKLAVSAPAGR